MGSSFCYASDAGFNQVHFISPNSFYWDLIIIIVSAIIYRMSLKLEKCCFMCTLSIYLEVWIGGRLSIQLNLNSTLAIWLLKGIDSNRKLKFIFDITLLKCNSCYYHTALYWNNFSHIQTSILSQILSLMHWWCWPNSKVQNLDTLLSHKQGQFWHHHWSKCFLILFLRFATRTLSVMCLFLTRFCETPLESWNTRISITYIHCF